MVAAFQAARPAMVERDSEVEEGMTVTQQTADPVKVKPMVVAWARGTDQPEGSTGR